MATPFSALSFREDVVGLDIDDGLAVAAISSVDSQGRVRLKKVGWTEYNPKGSNADIANAISRMWSREKFGVFSVVSCVRSRSLTLKRFQYPELSKSELKSALELDAEETLQSAAEEIVMDWRLNSENNQGFSNEHHVDGTLVCLPREDVDNHINILKKATLFPVATNISCFAIANLFKTGMQGCKGGMGAGDSDDKSEVVCLARLGQHSADISVFYGNGSIYPRTVFVHASQSKDPTKYFIDSINDVLSYYRFKLHLPDVDRLCLTGVVDDASLERIGASVDVPVSIWDPISDIHGMSRSITRRLDKAGLKVRAGVSVAMGLGLRA